MPGHAPRMRASVGLALPTLSSSEKAGIQAPAGPGVSPPALPAAAHAFWVGLLAVRRSERTDFLLVPAPLLSPPATYWARALARLGGSVRLAGARASLPARCGGPGGQSSGPGPQPAPNAPEPSGGGLAQGRQWQSQQTVFL